MNIAHWGPDPKDGHLVICLTPADDTHRLIHERHVTMAVFPVDDAHPYAGEGEHVLVTIHLNGGLALSHDRCVSGYVCVGCEQELVDSILSWGRGSIREHETGSDKATDTVPFHLVDPAGARTAIETAKSKLIPAN